MPRLWWRSGEVGGSTSSQRGEGSLQDVEVIKLTQLEGSPEMSGARGDSVENDDAPSSPQSPQFVRDWTGETGFESEPDESDYEDAVAGETLQIGETVIDLQVDGTAQPTYYQTLQLERRTSFTSALQRFMQCEVKEPESASATSSDQHGEQSLSGNGEDLEKQDYTS